jgi:hypothetical protein
MVLFYEAYYPPTVGVRRQHLNQVVTGNDDGTITVVSYNLLIRVATPERAAAPKGQSVIEAEPGLPAIAMHSVMIDRFRRDPGAWLAGRRVTLVAARSRLFPRTFSARVPWDTITGTRGRRQIGPVDLLQALAESDRMVLSAFHRFASTFECGCRFDVLSGIERIRVVA